jgi:hypothetical protein
MRLFRLKRILKENMSIKNLFIALICALLAISIYMGCSSKQENEVPSKGIHELYEKVGKDRENKAARSKQYSKEEEAGREKQMAVADACLKQLNACVDKCKNSSCEDMCLKDLSLCEKNLPFDLKTIKEK